MVQRRPLYRVYRAIADGFVVISASYGSHIILIGVDTRVSVSGTEWYTVEYYPGIELYNSSLGLAGEFVCNGESYIKRDGSIGTSVNEFGKSWSSRGYPYSLFTLSLPINWQCLPSATPGEIDNWNPIRYPDLPGDSVIIARNCCLSRGIEVTDTYRLQTCIFDVVAAEDYSGRGFCTTDITCSCVGGWTGVACNIPPVYCS